MTRPLSVAVLVKQVPLAEDFRLGPDGRLVRDHVPLEVNPYCRRAIAKGVELAAAGRSWRSRWAPRRRGGAAGGRGGRGRPGRPPVRSGLRRLRHARHRAGARRRDPLRRPFDLILAGLNSVDADTGQVAPELAELLGLPFASGVRQLEIEDAAARVTCERDDGTAELLVPLPAVLSVAERLCPPAKFGPAERAAVPAERITRLRAADLGPGPWAPRAARRASARSARTSTGAKAASWPARSPPRFSRRSGCSPRAGRCPGRAGRRRPGGAGR